MGLTILLVDDDQILTEKTKNSLNWDSLGIGMVLLQTISMRQREF